MLRISYYSEDFPSGTVSDGLSSLSVTWNDVLWAAMTVGRPSRQYVFQHGASSRHEAIFRLSLVRMSLEQSGPTAHRLRRTNAAKTLDPTEKGSVNYFLGMTFCKLFASKLLNTPWLLHLDVFRQQLNAVLTSRSRPDLIGLENGTNQWHAFECKGRGSPPDTVAKDKAKQQAQRLVSINSVPCILHIGAITYFDGDTLNFYWRDPPTEPGRGIAIPFDPIAWRNYYLPVFGLISTADGWEAMRTQVGAFLPIAELDLEVSAHPVIAQLLFSGDWAGAQRAAALKADEIIKSGYQPDGIAVRAGASWLVRFKDHSLGDG